MGNYFTFRHFYRFALSMAPKKEILFCLLFCAFSTIAFGQTRTWDGSDSDDWNTAGNWSGNAVPTASNNVVIPSAPTNQPKISGTAVARTVEVQSGATLTITSTGTLTTSNYRQIPNLTGTFASIHNFGTINNEGNFILNISGIAGVGFRNIGTLNNKTTGELKIDNSNVSAFTTESGSTVNNEGKITIGSAGNIGLTGILIGGSNTFNNKSTGIITIDRAVTNSISNGSTLNNEGTIKIGSINIGGLVAVLNTATFNNKATGVLEIDRATTNSISNTTNTFTNEGTIKIGANNGSGITALSSSATFNNKPNASITIDRASLVSLANLNSFTNEGNITIGGLDSGSPSGIVNSATFNNNAGEIKIDRTTLVGVSNLLGTFTNAAKITIGSSQGVGATGLGNNATFNNNTGGVISIDNSSTTALANNGGTFTNAAQITIGGVQNIGATGVSNNATFNNNAGGNISIDRATGNALNNQAGTFTNQAKVVIEALASVAGTGVNNASGATFDNNGCGALLKLVSNSVIANAGTFSNSGEIIENASGNSAISSNSGIVNNLNGGTFTIGSGNPVLTVTATNLTTCVPTNGNIDITGLHASTSYTVTSTSGPTVNVTASSDATGKLSLAGLGAGTYALTLSGSCVPESISLSATLTAPANPTLFTVAGSGSFCPNGTGLEITLSGSETGINYKLMQGATLITTVAGTGNALSFGNLLQAGTYTVEATNATTNCSSTMTGQAVLVAYSIPTATISGTMTVCKDAAAPVITFTGANGSGNYTFKYTLNNGPVLEVQTNGGTIATVTVPTTTAGVYTYELVSVNDVNCGQNQMGNAVVTVNGKPTVNLVLNTQTFIEGSTTVLCDADANPVNNLQFNVLTTCVTGTLMWRTQVGNGGWGEWGLTPPTTQPSDAKAYRYQASCDASCPSTFSGVINVAVQYRSAVPQNVSMIADGTKIEAGESKDVCDIEGNTLVVSATCGVGEVVLYSVDGGDYSSVVPSQMADGAVHNYRVRCRKEDGTPSCIESESAAMSLRLTPALAAPTVSFSTTSGCGNSVPLVATTSCGPLQTIWYDATTQQAIGTLPAQTPTVTTSYFARCQSATGCLSMASNTVTFTYFSTNMAPVVTVSADVVCTGEEVTISSNCPALSTAFWNTGVQESSFKVSFNNVTTQSYWVKCVFPNGCESTTSAHVDVRWKAFALTLINVGQSQSAVKVNDKAAWAGQFISPDAGPSLDKSSQVSPTVYFSERTNKTAPRFWTVNADACALGTNGSLTFDMLVTPETGVPRSFNTHENNAPYFMYANREGWTELYTQNHPAYGFFEDNGSGGNKYDEGLPKGLYKLAVRYWSEKGQGSIYPSTRQPVGNVLAYQEYWFRIVSEAGPGQGAARIASGQQSAFSEGEEKSRALAEVVPNPVTNVLRVQINDSKGQTFNLQLMDAAGRLMQTRTAVTESTQHQEVLDVSTQAAGIYFLKVLGTSKSQTLKVLKVE